jgi:hypothetical protein
VWFRQRSVDGEAIFRAAQLDEKHLRPHDVTAFVFEANGDFQERVEAVSARLASNYWQFDNAKVLTVGIEPQIVDRYLLATYLTPAQIRGAVGQTQAVSFWSLPEIVRTLDLAGLDATRYRLTVSIPAGAPGPADGHGSDRCIRFFKIFAVRWICRNGLEWRHGGFRVVCSYAYRRGPRHRRGGLDRVCRVGGSGHRRFARVP